MNGTADTSAVKYRKCLRGRSCADTKVSDDLFLAEGLFTLINMYNVLTSVWSSDSFLLAISSVRWDSARAVASKYSVLHV